MRGLDENSVDNRTDIFRFQISRPIKAFYFLDSFRELYRSIKKVKFLSPLRPLRILVRNSFRVFTQICLKHY